MKESAAQQRWRSYSPPIILILGLLVLWEVLVTWQAVPPWILPAPSQIIQAMWQNADLCIFETAWYCLNVTCLVFRFLQSEILCSLR